MTVPSGRRPAPGPGRNGSFEQMQQVLKSQEAANEEARQTLSQIRVAMAAMTTMFSGQGSHGSGYGAGPHGGRPTFNGDGTRRSGEYAYSPYGSAGQSFGRGSGAIRRAVTGGLERRYGASSGHTFQRVYDPVTGEEKGYNQINENGAVVGTHGPSWADTDEGKAALGAASKRGAISGVLGGLGEGGAMGAARAVPILGGIVAGAEAVHEGLTFVASQRAKNARWQDIYGGSNISQYGQRASQFGFQLSNLFGGGLTWGQSAQAFQGVSALGYQGQQRSNDLSFITQNYERMGVSVSDSLKLITAASTDLNQSLTGLQQGLKSTRQAAIATGQSGVTGTQTFTNNYTNLSKQYNDLTGGVTASASVLSTLQESMGRYGGNVNYSKMLTDPAQVQIMAGHMGMSYTQFVGLLQSGSPQDQKKIMQGVNYNLIRAVAPTLENSSLTAGINQQLASVTGVKGLTLGSAGKYMTPDVMNIVSQNLLQNADKYGLNVQALQSQLGSAGLQGLTPQQAMLQVLGVGSGRLNPEANLLNKPVAPNKYKAIQYATGGQATVSSADATRPGVNPVLDDAKKKLKGKDVQVVVNGQKRVVDIDTALKYYPDQIAKGSAVVEGSDGKTVNDLLLGEYQKNVITNPGGNSSDNAADSVSDLITNYSSKDIKNLGAAGSKSGSLKKEAGMSVSAYDAYQASQSKKQAAKNPGGAGGTVTIKPSAELLSLLSFSPSGNVAISYAAAAAGGIPAANPVGS